jgi:hypothetical protein
MQCTRETIKLSGVWVEVYVCKVISATVLSPVYKILNSMKDFVKYIR